MKKLTNGSKNLFIFRVNEIPGTEGDEGKTYAEALQKASTLPHKVFRFAYVCNDFDDKYMAIEVPAGTDLN